MNPSQTQYGQQDTSYKAAGQLPGITQLVDLFYDNMDSLAVASVIRNMHPQDLTESRTKLAYFLSGWLGGPKLYSQHYKPIGIPAVHKHLPVGQSEAEAWLHCMKQAIDQQPYEEAFKDYFIKQLRVPAERIKQVCSKQ
ncbi:MAG: group II truncated hemoglobin [Pseudomonadales bacterium]|nr:group II truncated hemoglobin [Pseudomonadales bacterium]